MIIAVVQGRRGTRQQFGKPGLALDQRQRARHPRRRDAEDRR